MNDKNNNGIPDEIDEALEEVRDIKRKFGLKFIIFALLVLVVLSGYAFGIFYYLDLRDKYITLQSLYDQSEREYEIELNKAIIAERQKLLKELSKKEKDIQEELKKRKEAREEIQKKLSSKEYKEKKLNESNNLSVDDLIHNFDSLGYKSWKGTK